MQNVMNTNMNSIIAKYLIVTKNDVMLNIKIVNIKMIIM